MHEKIQTTICSSDIHIQYNISDLFYFALSYSRTFTSSSGFLSSVPKTP